MIEVSEAYRAAIDAQSRRVLVRAAVDLISPTLAFGAVSGSTQSVFSDPDQLHDRVNTLGEPFLTTERNRWILGYSYETDQSVNSETGFETQNVFDEDAESEGFWVEETFSGVTLLQSFHVIFPNNDYDGFGVDFVAEVKYGDQVLQSFTITDNNQSDVYISGFDAYYPTSIKVTVTKWSLPNVRMRLVEIWPGSYEEWTDDMFAEFNIQRKGDLSAVSLPYTTCDLTVDNSTRRFDPLNKNGLFRSIEEKQGIEVSVSVNGSTYVRIGKFYQASGGWKTGNSTITLQWNLVSIIGLLVDKIIDITRITTWPTTLSGWITLIMGQLGTVFQNEFVIDDELADQTLRNQRSIPEGITCGDLLLWVCQAVRAWPRETNDGKLYIGRFSDQNNVADNLTFDNLNEYPSLQANEDIARIDITLADGTIYSASGISSSSQNTISINNPFILNATDAQELASYILGFYGGNLIETTGRGNPAREVGDKVTVQVYKDSILTGRILEDSVEIQDHVLKNCKTRILNIIENVAVDYDEYVVITENQTFTVPDYAKLVDGVATLYIILVGGGAAGGHGSWYPYKDLIGEANDELVQGVSGTQGHGGRIYFGSINANAGQTFQVNIGVRGERQNIFVDAFSSEYYEYFQENGWPDMPIGTPTSYPANVRNYYLNRIPGGTLGTIPSYYCDGDTSESDGGESTFGNYSSALGSYYPAGYNDPITSQIYGRANQTNPIANRGEGGIAGVGIVPDKARSQGSPPTYGKPGSSGCVIVAYKVIDIRITSQPVDFVGNIGDTATFTVVATGDGLTYQWQVSTDGGSTWLNSGLPGNTTSTFTPEITQQRLSYLFRCKITDENSNVVVSNVVRMRTE